MKKYLILCVICLLSVSQVWAANNTTLVVTLTDAGDRALSESDLSASDIALFSATLKWKHLTINLPGVYGRFFLLPDKTWAMQISLQGFNDAGDVPLESVDPGLSAMDLTITTNLGKTVDAVIKRTVASGAQKLRLDITPPAVSPKINFSDATICARSATDVTITDAPADLTTNYTISVPAGFSVSALSAIPITITANAGTAAGSYTVKLMKNGTPPTEAASAVLTVGATPALTISATSGQLDGVDAYYCEGAGAKDKVKLSASNPGGGTYSYQWSGKSTEKKSSIDVADAGTYTVTATSSGGGCPATAEIVVKEHTRPGGVTITNTVADVCANVGSGSTTLTHGTASVGSGGGTLTYVWSGGAVNASGVVNNQSVEATAAGTTYKLTVSDNKCSSTATYALKGHTLTPKLTPNSGSFASGTEVAMTATPNQTPAQTPAGITYAWTGSDLKNPSTVASATSIAVTSGNSPLKYKVEASDAYCKDAVSDEVAYSVTAGSEVEIATINGGQACEADVALTATIQKGTGPYTYTWSSAGLTFTPANGSTSKSVASTASGAAGSYKAKLTVTDAKGVVAAEKEVAVKIYAKPTLTDVTVTSSEICVGNGNMVTLQANGGAAATPPLDNSATLNYVWTGAGKLADQTKASATLAAGETTYKVKIVDGNNCESPERTVKHTGHQVTVVAKINNSATSVAIPYGSTANLSSTVTLNPNAAPNSYEWTPVAGIDGDASNDRATTTKLTASGLYTIEVTDNNGCKASDDIPYTVSGTALSVTTQPAYICAGADTKLSCVPSGGSGSATLNYLWTSLDPGLSFVDATVATPQITTTTPAGTYRVKVQVTKGAQTAESAEVIITIGAQPKITGIGIYQGGNLILDDGVSSVLPNSTVDIIAVVNAAAGTTYTWSPMGQIANISGDKLTATSAPLALGNACFKLELKNAEGKCPASNEACVPVRGTEFLVDMKDQTICAGTPFNITSLGAVSGGTKPYKNYAWTCADPAFLFTSNGASITVSAATAPGIYTVRLDVDDDKGNHASPEDFIVTVNAIPKFIAVSTTPQTVKVGNKVTLSASATPIASTLTWAPGGPVEGAQTGTTGTASIVAGTFTTAGGPFQYTVRATNGTCTKDTIIEINVIDKTEEIVIKADDIQACEGAGGTLTASATGGGTGGLSYRWEVISGNIVLESTTGPSVNIASAGPGTHRVKVYVTDKSADPAPAQEKTITVTVHANPVIDPIVVTNIATNTTGTTVEIGDELKLTTSVNPGNATLAWTESGSGNSLLSTTGKEVFTTPVTDTKTYTVTATANGTCTASREVTVTVNKPTTGALLELELEKKCADSGESMVLSMKATGGTTYSFTLKNNKGSVNKTFTGSSPWLHSITLTDQDTYFVHDFKAFKNGVEINPTKVVPAQIEALFYVTPSITITNGNVQTVCQGDALTLAASSQLAGTTYSWNNGVVNGEAFHPKTSGVYTVTATSDKGCIAKTDVSVTIIPKPTVTIGASPETICLGDTVTLTAGGSATEFVWNSGQTGSPITVVPNVGGTIRYVVTGKEMLNGCTDTATVKVVVNEPPKITSASKAVRSIAIGKSVTFGVKASGKGLSYQWQRWSGSSWLTLYDASDDQPAISGSHSDSLKLINVPKSWDGTKLQCVVTNSCGVADTTFTLNVKECFDILDVEWDMCYGIRPEKDPAVAIDGWYCPGSRIAICARLVLDDPDVELENAVYKWTVDGLSTTDGRWGEMKFISDSSILSWIPPVEWQDNITIALCAYIDGACDTICKSYLRLKAMKYTDLAWEMKTSVDPTRMFCPGDTVTCWINDPGKTAGLNPTYKWYNDIFDLEVESPTHNKVVSLKNDQVVLAMGQQDSWMKVIMTPSPEICTREPHYMDTAFLQVKKFVEPSLRIDCADTIACRRDSVRMSAIYANAGLNPTFQWQRSIGDPFPDWNLGTKPHATVYLDEKDVWVKCVMKPSADVCYDKTKALVDAIQIKVLQAEGSIQIACDMKDREPGDELLFTSEVKDVLGDHKYEWMVNGRLAPEGDSEYSCSTLRSGDVVYCLVSGERLCQSRIQSNEIIVDFGRVTRDTVITIYRNERVQNLKLFKAGDEGKLFLIDKFPHDGIALLTLLGGQFNYVPNRNFVGVDYVHYLVKDKFDPSKVEEGHIYINVKENGLDNLPNVITPNGDGLNDEWHLETITEKYTDYEITIYNRIGNVVFHCKNNYTNDWNGQTISNPNYEMPLGVLQSGIYTYVISLDRGQKKIISWLEIRAGLSRGSYR